VASDVAGNAVGQVAVLHRSTSASRDIGVGKAHPMAPSNVVMGARGGN
jgi:hypothetical protein